MQIQALVDDGQYLPLIFILLAKTSHSNYTQ